MSQDLVIETGVNLLLADTKKEFDSEQEGNFELVLNWNEVKNTLTLQRIVPDESGNSHSLIKRELGEYVPIIDIVLEYLLKVRQEFSNVEIHFESENFADIYFPEK